MAKFIGVRHVGLPAKNIAPLKAFYTDVMGMVVMRESNADGPFGVTLFMTSHPDKEDHEVVFFQTMPELAHTAVEVESLADLKKFYREIKERGIPIKYALNHGNSFSFYFDDPEGNMLEVYWPIYVRFLQNYAEPIDFDLPEEELMRVVDQVTKQFGTPIPTMPKMAKFIGVHHVGRWGKNLATLKAFYTDVMGMSVQRESPPEASFGSSLFLSSHPDKEDHEIVFFGTKPELAHTAFKVASLVLRSSLALSFLPAKPIGRICLLCL